jgi:hypothetical protein
VLYVGGCGKTSQGERCQRVPGTVVLGGEVDVAGKG